MNPQEVRRQKFDHIKKQALIVLTTALRAPLFAMLGCGYAGGNYLYDHGGKKVVYNKRLDKEEYDQELHGKIFGFIEEGQQVPGAPPDSTTGKKPIHRHNRTGFGGIIGPYEFQYE